MTSTKKGEYEKFQRFEKVKEKSLARVYHFKNLFSSHEKFAHYVIM